MISIDYKYLKFIRFKDITQWDLKRYLNVSFKSKYDIVKLIGHINEEGKKYNISEKNKKYGILGVNNQTGIFDAYTEKGENIKQKYKKMEVGWIAYNPYRVNVGSIGIKKQEHYNDYISPAYVVFSCLPSLYPDYLFMVMKTPLFNKIIRDNTTGSVRQNLSFDILKELSLPKPEFSKQLELVSAYNDKIKHSKALEKQAAQVEQDIEDYLLSELGIKQKGYIQAEQTATVVSEPQMEYVVNNRQLEDRADTYHWGDEIKKEYKYLKFVRFRDVERWDVSFFSQKNTIIGNYDTISMSKCIDSFMQDQQGNTLRIETSKYPETTYQYIGMENIEKETGELLEEKIVKGSDIKSQTVRVPKSFFLYGKLRPYLNKYWHNESDNKNIVCSSEFFVFSIKSTINPYYFKYYLASSAVQQQIANAYRGARMPRINEETFKAIEVPIPPIDIQNSIVEHIKEQKEQIKQMKQQAEKLRKEALEEFEKEIFE